MPENDSQSPTVPLKPAVSAPQNAVIGASTIRGRPSHSDRHLSMTDPDIHTAILKSFSLSRRIDRQMTSISAAATAVAARVSSHVQPWSPSQAAEASSIKEEEESDILDIFRRSSGSLSSDPSVDSWRQRIYNEDRLSGWLLRLVDSMLTASLRSKLSLQMFRSHLSIHKEQRRQIETNRFIIHPFSNFRTLWSLAMVLALALTVVTLPLEIAFYSTSKLTDAFDTTDQEITYSRVMGIAAGVVFFVDIIINFRTGYVLQQTDEVVLESGPIIFHYLRTWFIFDLLSTVPFDVIYTSLLTIENMTDDEKFFALRLSKMLRLLAIFRLARLARYASSLQTVFWLKSKPIELFNVVAMIFILGHWNGCLQYTFCYIEHYPNFPPESWIYRDGLHLNNVTTARRYTRCVFRAMSHMLAVGYGQSPPTITSETWVVMCSMLIGITLYAMFVAYLARLVASLDYSGRKYEAMVSELKEFLRFHKVPVGLQHRVLDFYDHKYRRKFFEEDKFLKRSIVSPPLRKEIAMHSCRHLVRNVTFFKNASTDFIYQIVSRLEFQVYFPREIITNAGHMTEGMYFIEHGRVEVRLPTGEVLEKIPEGGYFGEISLVFGEKQETNVIATDMCDIYCLSKSGFDEVLKEYPEIKNSIETLAAVRRRQHQKSTGDEELSLKSIGLASTQGAPFPSTDATP